MKLTVDQKLVDEAFRNVMKNYNTPKAQANRNLNKFYLDKIHTDAKLLSVKGISSKTYNIKDFDLDLHSFLFNLQRLHGYKYVVNDDSTFIINWI